MAKMFRVMIPQSMSPEESYEIFENFFDLGFDVYDHYHTIAPMQKRRDYFDAFWGDNSTPPLPEVPPNVQIIDLYP